MDWYADSLGYTVSAGVVVGYEEEFDPNEDQKYYVVKSVGEKVEMRECDLDDNGEVQNECGDVITVERHMIGAV